jgi:hypothetical protein
MPTDKNIISNVVKAVKLSKTLFQDIISQEKMTDYCEKVLSHEVNDLSLDRSIQSIGIRPSNIHQYENFIMYKDLASDSNDSLPYSAAASRAIQFEMVLSLLKPKNILFYTSSFWAFPVDYLEQLSVENVYIPNDEDLYRAENVYLNREISLNVLESSDLDLAIFPEDIDLVCVNGTVVASNLNQDLLLEIYSKLNSGSVIFIDNNNDFLQYYVNGSDTDPVNLSNPLHDLNQAIGLLPNSSVYHIPTMAGFTVIIKG